MDMTPEQLYDLIEPQRHGGAMETITELRCPNQRCHLIGKYQLRNQQVTIATQVKMSPAMADKINRGSRVIPGRAWLGDVPDKTIYGCRHAVRMIGIEEPLSIKGGVSA